MEFEKLKKVIADVLNVDPDEIGMDSTFVDDLGADSLDDPGVLPVLTDGVEVHGLAGRFVYHFHFSYLRS